MSQIWNNILDLFEGALAGLHDVFEPIAGAHAWGFAIIALTLIVRLVLLPLAIKQIRSMRAMQAIQPQMKAIQKKYKVDRELMRKDPEQYRAKRQKMNEELMALYQAEGVNPAASCLPLLAQAPVFFALFSILRGERAAELANEPFYFLTTQVAADAEFTGLGALVSQASWPGWLLVVLMAVTMFISQKQTMARQAVTGGDSTMAQQQRIMLYAMPVLLAVFSWQLPLGVLLYWVTTNAWQAGQQWFMLREVAHEAEEGTLAAHRGGERAASTEGRRKGRKGGEGRDGGSTPPAGGSSARPTGRSATSGGAGNAGSRKKPAGGGGSNGTGASSRGAGSSAGSGKRDHLPRRGQRR